MTEIWLSSWGFLRALFLEYTSEWSILIGQKNLLFFCWDNLITESASWSMSFLSFLKNCSYIIFSVAFEMFLFVLLASKISKIFMTNMKIEQLEKNIYIFWLLTFDPGRLFLRWSEASRSNNASFLCSRFEPLALCNHKPISLF